jgi:hypothetical protein
MTSNNLRIRMTVMPHTLKALRYYAKQRGESISEVANWLIKEEVERFKQCASQKE